MKFVDSIAHAKYCGADNELIKANLKRLSEESNVTIWIRTPIIPQATDTVENIHAIALFLTNNHIRYDRWELCAFNNLCKDKYTRLHQVWEFENAPLITKEKMMALTEVARRVTGKTDQISATGLTLFEEDKHE
jgi:pyruvate formate lyase activating enzyme